MESSAKFWNKMAARYSKMPIRDPGAYETTLDRTRAYLSPEDQALELGCGTGGTARLLSANVAHITGTDIAPRMIEIARQRAEEEGVANITFETSEIGNAPKSPFDVVMAYNLLHLLTDLPASLAQIHARVKPGGLFISKTICLGQPGLGWKLKMILKLIPLLRIIGKAPDLRYLSITELEEMIEATGFEVIETGSFPAHPPSRFIVARRNF
jgi:2-polyprenyl-3-methyl-5-hydroxy-6-metoxy-1,4-benzoquinol methylase